MTPPSQPWVAGIVLAAGCSHRFDSTTIKQLAVLGGQPLVVRAAQAALASRLAQVSVVVGHRAADVRSTLAGLPLVLIDNPDHREGQSTSVRAGLDGVPPQADAAVIVPCDQPFLHAGVIDRLIDAYGATRPAAVVPTHAGRNGAPVLLDRSLFAAVAGLRGDTGARAILRQTRRPVTRITLLSDLALRDVDTVADLETLRRLDPDDYPS